MKITFLQSACVLIESDNTKILCDPWLVDGEYYGSWSLYPPYELKPEKFDDVDYIYISHIHPDHCSPKTLSRLNKNIPVLIHNFPVKFLKNTIERLGFKVIELEHDKRTRLKNNLHINILAADNCDPSICGRFFGCAPLEYKFGTTQLDTMCVIDDGTEVLVNTNDCPYELAYTAAKKIKENYKNVDMLLVGYSGASPYPHCFDMDENEKKIAIKNKKEKMFKFGKNYVELFEPKYFMPFAGRYTLAGNLSAYNYSRGEPELEEAMEYFASNVDQSKHKCITLNLNASFDTRTGIASEPYTPINADEKKKYVNSVLSNVKLDYENEKKPEAQELIDLIPKSYERFERHRKNIGFTSDTVVQIELSEDITAVISCNGTGYQLVKNNETNSFNKYLKTTLDPRLLKWILSKPQKAHWNNAEIGAHIKFKRVPDVYERGLHYSLSFFHA